MAIISKLIPKINKIIMHHEVAEFILRMQDYFNIYRLK